MGNTKRAFVKSCCRAAVTAACWPLLAPFVGCRQNAGPRPLPETNGRPTPTRTDVADLAAIDSDFEAGYLKLHRAGELEKRGRELWDLMKECRLCPRQCGAGSPCCSVRSVVLVQRIVAALRVARPLRCSLARSGRVMASQDGRGQAASPTNRSLADCASSESR